jgi:hypothetical protein
MKAVKTFEEFLYESSNYNKDKIFWDSLDVKEQNLIYKDFGFGKINSKKDYEGLNSDFYSELSNYLEQINYNKSMLGKNPQRYI